GGGEAAVAGSVRTEEPQRPAAPAPAGPAPAGVKGVIASAEPVNGDTAQGQGDPGGAAEEPGLEKMSREKRLLLTPSEEREVERLGADMASHLKTPLKTSHVLRATVTLLRHAGDELLRQSRRVGPPKRPPNNHTLALA